MNKLKLTGLAISLTLISGCSTIQNYIGKVADANDEAIKAAEFAICKGASVGSVLRRYDTPEKAKAWADLCESKNSVADIVVSGG